MCAQMNKAGLYNIY